MWNINKDHWFNDNKCHPGYISFVYLLLLDWFVATCFKDVIITTYTVYTCIVFFLFIFYKVHLIYFIPIRLRLHIAYNIPLVCEC